MLVLIVTWQSDK